MVVKKETIDVRYCDFCETKETDDEAYVLTCKFCGKDACSKHCHRLKVNYSSPTLYSNIQKQEEFTFQLCEDCTILEEKKLREFLLLQGYYSGRIV